MIPFAWPLLKHDLVRSVRRGRLTLLRTLYAAALLCLLIWMFGSWRVHEILRPSRMSWSLPFLEVRDAARLAAAYFYGFMAAQALLTFLLVPPFVSGAIAEEKEHGRLEALFVAGLPGHQIVMTLLVTRLARVAMILLAGLPVLGILQFLGGIDPNLLLASFLATGVTMLSTAGIGMLFSIYASKARQALMRSQFVVLGYLALTGFLEWSMEGLRNFGLGGVLLNNVFGYTAGDVLSWPGNGNPGVVAYRFVQRLSGGTWFFTLLGEAIKTYLVFHGAIALICIVWAALAVKTVALRQPIPWDSPFVRRRISTLRAWWHRCLVDRPLLWKGAVIDSRIKRRPLGALIKGAGLALVFWPAIHMCYCFDRISPGGNNDHLVGSIGNWCKVVSGVLLAIIWAGVMLRAAVSIAGERDRETLDSLLATPLTNRGIIIGKWLGAMFAMPGYWAVLAIVWLFALWMHALHPVALPCLLLAWFADAAVTAAVGVWLSAASRTARRAVIATFLLVLLPLLGVLPGFVVLDLVRKRFEAMTLLPPISFGALAFSHQDLEEGLYPAMPFGTMPLIVSRSAGAVIVPLLLTLAFFDFRRTTGRREDGARERTDAVGGEKAIDLAIRDDFISLPTGRWKQRLGHAVLLLLPPTLLAGWYVVLRQVDAERLAEAFAVLDKSDPGWRIEEIEASRAVASDDQNSANRVAEALTLLPPNWSEGLIHRWNMIVAVPPNEFLPRRHRPTLRGELEEKAAALEVACGLADLPRGRFPSTYPKAGAIRRAAPAEQARHLALLLFLDAIDHVQAGDAETAMRICQAIVNTGRAIGDEPVLRSQVHRSGTLRLAFGAIERTLALSEPSSASLEVLQRLLEEDEKHPLLITALRSERAAVDAALEALRLGDINLIELIDEPRSNRHISAWSSEVFVLLLGSLKSQRVEILDYFTRMVEAVRLPPEQQDAVLAPIRPGRTQFLARAVLTAGDRFATDVRRFLAEERCTIVALAAERYRRDHSAWPGKLADLAPAYLAKLPLDPHTGKALLYRHLPDGVVIYSVGPDLTDDKGKLDRREFSQPPYDVGIQLWDLAARRRPAEPAGVP
jgi:ABC-type transport system involved in multi-copper enzyme maturation permease subunit